MPSDRKRIRRQGSYRKRILYDILSKQDKEQIANLYCDVKEPKIATPGEQGNKSDCWEISKCFGSVKMAIL